MHIFVPNVNILGVNVSLITVDQLHEEMRTIIIRGEKYPILNVNVHCLNLAFENKWYRDFLNSSPIVFCDGKGVQLTSLWFLKVRIPEQITYAEWMWNLSSFCEKEGYSLYFLGAKPGIALAAAQNLRARFPRLQIVGVHHGYFDRRGSENENIIQEINLLRPNIVVVGLGMPHQEEWIKDNIERLNVNVFLSGGACFDFVSGNTPRAPNWMSRCGLEWLHRLMLEPKRLWKRYVMGNPLFLWRILLQSIDVRFRKFSENNND